MKNSGLKILIAEDSAIQAETLRRLLAAEGYSVSVAKDGAEGLSMAKELKPALIISDIIMPEMSGFELCRHIKNDADLGSTPVILLTSLSDPADVINGLECGADNFIVKPYNEHHLLSRIKHIFLSREFQETERTQMGVEIHFAGRKYFITSEKKQILDLLISTYESAVQKNIELINVQEELKLLNDELEQKVRERTAALTEEIAERKKVEYNLLTEKQKLESLVKSIGAGLSLLDSETRIVWANEILKEWFGPIEKLKGRFCHELYELKDIQKECAALRTLRSGQIEQGEIFASLIGGKIRYFKLITAPIKDENGRIVQMTELTLDITEQKQLEDQLRHAQKMEAVGTLAGGIAHDFNNILNVIMGYGSMVYDRLEAGSRSKEQMNEVLTAAERAANLTKRLLVFSRKQVVEVKPVNINEIITGIQKMLARMIRENIEINLNLADRPLIVMADVGQIEQILMNLATNARDAMPEGGRLTIGTGLQELDDEYVAAYGYGTPGKYALITIADTGCGIDADTQQKIFEPFFTTKGIGEGTGLGLAISYGIIKQHSGYIKVYSELGKGTEFKIYLPIIEEIVALGTKIETLVSIKGGNETILVAEDDASLRKLSRTVLESFGYTVIIAEDGEDAIAKFMENRDKIQLVILDMIMPKKNGKEASAEIRKMSPGIKTLFMSGYTMDIIKTRELTEAGFDFILKPVALKALASKVREILDR